MKQKTMQLLHSWYQYKEFASQLSRPGTPVTVYSDLQTGYHSSISCRIEHAPLAEQGSSPPHGASMLPIWTAEGMSTLQVVVESDRRHRPPISATDFVSDRDLPHRSRQVEWHKQQVVEVEGRWMAMNIAIVWKAGWTPRWRIVRELLL